MSITTPLRRLAEITLIAGKETAVQSFKHQTPLNRETWAHRCAGRVAKSLSITTSCFGEMPHSGSLIVCNHRSYIDGIVLASMFPAHFIAKKEVQQWPLLGNALSLSPLIFVDRGNRDSGARVQAEVIELLHAGHSVVNFSEGTTSNINGVLPFKPGMFEAVHGHYIQIVPAAIAYRANNAVVEWVGSDTFVDHLWKLVKHKGLHAHVSFGPTVWSNDFESPAELMDRVYSQVRFCWDKRVLSDNIVC